MSKSKYIFTEEQEQKIIEFYLVPNSLNDTANAFNIHTRIVDKILLKYNIKKHSPDVVKQIEISKHIKVKSADQEKEIIDFYLYPNSLLETAKQFNLSTRSVKRILVKNNISEHSEDIKNKLMIENRKPRKNISEQEEQEIINFYLTPNSLADTCKKFNYGSHIINRILDKYKITKHDNKTFRQIQVEKSKKTNIQKYGVESILSLRNLKEDAILIKYGAKNPMQIKEIQEKTKQTNLERYGFENPMQSDIVKEKSKQTCLNRYGVTNGGASKEALEKIKQTNLKRYGVENSFQSEDVKKKIKDSLFKNYGMYHAPTKKYIYNSEYFDSFPELCFYLYHITNNIEIKREPVELKFTFNNKEYSYYPDFQVGEKLYEIKGNQFLTEEGKWQNPFDHTLDELFEAKRQCAIKNNVIILYEKYYQKYVDWFEIHSYQKEEFLVKK